MLKQCLALVDCNSFYCSSQAVFEPQLWTTPLVVLSNTVALGSLVHTDKDAIYCRLLDWGYEHKHVNHGRGKYARDEDGDGFCEAHVNTMEGFWSLLRSGLRPHRGISQDKLPLYLGNFMFVHNIRTYALLLLKL